MMTHRVVCLLFSLSKHPWLYEIVLCCTRSTFCPNACGFSLLFHSSTAIWDSLLLSLPPLLIRKTHTIWTLFILILLAKWFSWRSWTLSFTSLYSLHLIEIYFVQKKRNKINVWCMQNKFSWMFTFSPSFFSDTQNFLVIKTDYSRFLP